MPSCSEGKEACQGNNASQPQQDTHSQKKPIMNMYKGIWNFKPFKDKIRKLVPVSCETKRGLQVKELQFVIRRPASQTERLPSCTLHVCFDTNNSKGPAFTSRVSLLCDLPILQMKDGKIFFPSLLDRPQSCPCLRVIFVVPCGGEKQVARRLKY